MHVTVINRSLQEPSLTDGHGKECILPLDCPAVFEF